jgi:hypothetical protein
MGAIVIAQKLPCVDLLDITKFWPRPARASGPAQWPRRWDRLIDATPHTLPLVARAAVLAVLLCIAGGLSPGASGAATTGTDHRPVQNLPVSPAGYRTSTEPSEFQGVLQGKVLWPDGVPAANVRVDFYPMGEPATTLGSYTTDYAQIRTDSSGKYALQGSFSNPVAYFYAPPNPSPRYDRLEENDCYVNMNSSVQQDGTVDWIMVNMPCSRTYIPPSKWNILAPGLVNNPQQTTGGAWQYRRADPS